MEKLDLLIKDALKRSVDEMELPNDWEKRVPGMDFVHKKRSESDKTKSQDSKEPDR